MAKQVLPTNFVDDILAPSMGRKRKYRIIDNGDDTYSFEDVTDYTQTGSDFGAGQINSTNQAVNESCDKANVIETMDDIVANQANGMIAGAKAVAELNGKLDGIKITRKSYHMTLKPNSYVGGNMGTFQIPDEDIKKYGYVISATFAGGSTAPGSVYITRISDGWLAYASCVDGTGNLIVQFLNVTLE